MKKFKYSVLLLIVITITSCASISFPGYENGVTVTLEPKTYDILGDVVIEGTTSSVLGIVTWGGATYYDLIKKAQKNYTADDVINISLDKKAGMFLGVYYTYTYVLRGIAVKYN